MSFLNSVKMSIFSTGVNHDFPQKIEISSKFNFFEKGLGMMFDDVLDKEKCFLDYEKVILR